MSTEITWTGEKATLLQDALGLSVRQFASHLGIDPRTVSKWRQKGALRTCNTEMQQVLTHALGLATDVQRAAFHAKLPSQPAAVETSSATPAPCSVVSHKFVPAWLGSRVTDLLRGATPSLEGPGGLEKRTVVVDHPTARTTIHLLACGVAVAHMQELVSPASLTDLALWRYRSYPNDRTWVGSCLERLLADAPSSGPVDQPQYAFSVYELREHSWGADGLETALQLLTTPSVLVNRQNPAAIESAGAHVEAEKFSSGWSHPGVLPFHGGVSAGLAGWSGVAYHPLPDEHALSVAEIVALEVDVQALWALSSEILQSVERGEDPVMPEEYGWRYLRGAYSRLRAARPTETTQHRAMREAILATSELPDRLRDAQDALRDSRV